MLISNLLRQRLAELDMSQADLARQLTLRGQGTTRANISHWIRARHKPPLEDSDFRMALAASLQLDVNELMARSGFTIVDEERSSEALRAAEIVERLPSDAKSLALEYLDMLDHRFIKQR